MSLKNAFGWAVGLCVVVILAVIEDHLVGKIGILKVYLGIVFFASITFNIMFCQRWSRDTRSEVKRWKKKSYDFMSNKPAEQFFYHLTLAIVASGFLLAFGWWPQIMEMISSR